jgi:hypothetical protein
MPLLNPKVLLNANATKEYLLPPEIMPSRKWFYPPRMAIT